MSTARPGVYDLDLTCRCCLQNVAIWPLITIKTEQDLVDSDLKNMTQEPIGDVLVEFANVQFSPDDGLPQKVCDECVATLRPAFVFRKMCQESDIKLREYFRQRLTVNPVRDDDEMRFDDLEYTKDSDGESIFDEKNDFLVGLSVKDDQTSDQAKNETNAVIGIDTETQPVVVSVDMQVNNSDPKPCNTSRASGKTAKSITKTGRKTRSKAKASAAETKRKYRTKSNGQVDNAKLKTKSDGNPWRHKCTVCSKPKTFALFGPFKKHMAKHGQEVVERAPAGKQSKRKVTCDICKAQLIYDQSNLMVHMEGHSSNNKFRRLCESCGKTFAHPRALRAHILLVHSGDQPFKCDICHKAFHQRYLLSTHKTTHLAVKPYPCTHCDKTFVHRRKLTIHTRIHTGERPYVCGYCDKAFYNDSNLKAHVRIHTGERPFRCNQCGETFSQSQSLLKHRRKFDHFDPPAAKFPRQQ